MAIFFIPTLGYVSDKEQFTFNEVTYPCGWLKSTENASSIGAITRPPLSDHQRIERSNAGWTVTAFTEEEIVAQDEAVAIDLASQTAAILKAAQDRLWAETWDVWAENQLAAVDRGTIGTWVRHGLLSEAGIQMEKDLVIWKDAVFVGPYSTAKAAITEAGVWIEPDWEAWTADCPCPHSFYDFVATRIA